MLYGCLYKCWGSFDKDLGLLRSVLVLILESTAGLLLRGQRGGCQNYGPFLGSLV